MTPQEKTLLIELERRINRLEKAERYLFEKNIEIFDGKNIKFGISGGTKIGTAATEKIGFYGATPIVRRPADTNSSGHYTGAGTAVTDQSTFDGDGTNSTKYSISGIVKALKELGFLTQ